MTFKQIISKFDKAKLAEHLGVSTVTVRAWGNRRSIPSRYWAGIIEFAAANLITLTYEQLAACAESEAA